MRNLLSLFGCYFFVSLAIINAQEQSVTLSIPNEYCVTSTPTIGATIDYNVTEHLTQCINIFGANLGSTAVNLQMGNNPMGQGQTSSVAIALLKSVSTSGQGSSFNFGLDCGEEGADDANVNVLYAGAQASLDQLATPSTAFILDISDEVMRASNNEPIEGPAEQTYLMVEASPTNTATISIGQDPRQGQCFVLLFDAVTGAMVATLNPKAGTEQMHVTSKSLYVVPIIKPKTGREAGNTTITWEVGDPKRNGKVIVEEEG
ncbi:MAG: hypothetical protein HKN09_10485 [Saprospiraceae bacterium]|nr:hypothetical protein [Saprospiraceae bacterium]